MAIKPASKKNTTRERLIHQAIRLIWLHGYTEVSIGVIAKAAKAQKGSVYHFFPSKLDLLMACFEHLNVLHKNKLQQISDREASPQAVLMGYLSWLCETQKHAQKRYGYTPGFFYMALGGAITDSGSQLAIKLKSAHDAHRVYLHQIFIDMAENHGLASEPIILGDTVMFMATGAAAVARNTNDTQVLDDMLIAVELLLATHQLDI